MTEQETIALFKCLADKSRLLILKSLAVESMYVERLAERLSLTPATVSFHLKKLEAIGAVSSQKDQYYTMYSINKDLFSYRIIDLIQEESSEQKLQAERDEAYRQKILSSFIKYGKLVSIPAQRKKKRVILEEIVSNFQSGRTYTEKEVNIIIAEYHDDFCTLRRDMISEGLLEREGSIYKKC